ncbi:MAG: hypothetical protein LBK06_00255 [Planctomycetaceae bacterium]|jgi:hypothetical protein|nr:hypothetical protein [Planctomycetaceae bacterium]
MKHLLPIILLVCLAGCASSNPQGRVPISGEVLLNGQPLKEGNVEFSSVAGSTPMMMTSATIKNGKFETTAADGLIPGQTYTVKFSATEEIAGEFNVAPNGEKTPLTKDIIPPQWGHESKETITCEKGKENKFDFKL